MRSLVALLVLALSCLTGAASARAQSCHEPVRPGDAGWTAGARLGLGAADNEHDAGQWQSLTLEGDWRSGRWAFRLQQPLLHLDRSGYSEVGLGDTVLGSSLLLHRNEASNDATFATLNATLPLGDQEAELGMGHPMVMAGLAHEHSFGRVALTGELGFATTLQIHDHAEAETTVAKHAETAVVHSHAGGFAPLVAPMNEQEVWYAARLATSLGATVDGSIFAGGALPVGHEEGSARLEVGPALSWDSGPATYWVAGALPVVGEVMDWRAELGLRWSFGVGAASSRCRCNGAP
jgi:hypothetical protein